MGVNVRVVVERVAALGSELNREIVTGAMGAEARTTVKLAEPPNSVVKRPEVGVITTAPTAMGMLAEADKAPPMPVFPRSFITI